VISLPGYAAVSLFEKDSSPPGDECYGWADRAALATNQWVSAGILALLFLVAAELGVPVRVAFCLSLASGLSTLIWPYSRDYFSQPLAAFCILLAFYFLLRFSRTFLPGDLRAASASLGLALLARMDMAAVSAGLFISGWLLLRRVPRKNDPSEKTPQLADLLWPFSVAAGVLLVFDWYRWGKWLGAPYGTQNFDSILIDTIPRFLFSLRLSVFLYNPLLVASLVALFLTWKYRRDLWIGILFADAAYGYVVARYNDYHGGLCVGPRYFLSLVPLNLVFLLAVLGETRFRKRGWLLALVPLTALGLALNGYWTLVDYRDGSWAPNLWLALLGK
jgi:hypothetical protein